MDRWIDTIGYISADPGRVAVMVTLSQVNQPVDEPGLAQAASLLHQQITGQAVEVAVVIAHINDLASRGLIERDATGFRWQPTALGTLASRQWSGGSLEPAGSAPLDQAEVRAWRDRLISQLDEDARLAERAGIDAAELLASLGARLAELSVLNRVLGERTLPVWLDSMVRTAQDDLNA